MSHIVVVKFKILDLDMLKSAAIAVGGQFNENVRQFNYYGMSKGSSMHTITVAKNSPLYKQGIKEIGVVAAKDGKGYELAFDPFAGGNGLVDVFGQNCNKLIQEYILQVEENKARHLKMQGWKVERVLDEKTKRVRLKITSPDHLSKKKTQTANVAQMVRF